MKNCDPLGSFESNCDYIMFHHLCSHCVVNTWAEIFGVPSTVQKKLVMTVNTFLEEFLIWFLIDIC